MYIMAAYWYGIFPSIMYIMAAYWYGIFLLTRTVSVSRIPSTKGLSSAITCKDSSREINLFTDV